MAADWKMVSTMGILCSVCSLVLMILILSPESTEAAYRSYSYRSYSYRSYSYRSYSYRSYSYYSYRSYSYRSYSSYRSYAYYSYTPYSTLRYYRSYYYYPYSYYSMYFNYRPYGSGVYMSRDSFASGTLVCENWIANDNGTALGYFTCPLLTSEPSGYTACCGTAGEQYCCPETLSTAAIAGIVVGSIVAVLIIIGVSICVYQSCKQSQRKVTPPRQDIRMPVASGQASNVIPGPQGHAMSGPKPTQLGYGVPPPRNGPPPPALPPLGPGVVPPHGAYGSAPPGPYGPPPPMDPYGVPGPALYGAAPPGYPPPAYMPSADPAYPPSSSQPSPYVANIGGAETAKYPSPPVAS